MPNLRTVPLMTLLFWVFFRFFFFFFSVAASSLSCGPWLFIVVQASLVVARRCSSFGTWDPVNRLRCPAAYGILIPQARDWTHIHCIGRWILNHWAIREHPVITVFSKHITQTAQVIQGTRWESPCVFQWGLIFSIMFLCNWLLKLKGEILCLSVWLCMCVCVRERERDDEGIPGNLWSSAPAKQTWDSAHTCEIWMSFVPWESHSAWLIQAELPAASFQDTVQTRILMEITAGRRSDLREGGGCRAGSLASWWDLSIHDLEPLIWKQYVMQGGPFPRVSRASLYPLPRLFFSYLF